jgi:hypothetical protein
MATKRKKSVTIGEKISEANKKRKRQVAQLDQVGEEGFHFLGGEARFFYKRIDPKSAPATLIFTARASKAEIYLAQKPVSLLLDILRRRGENDPTLYRIVREKAVRLFPSGVDSQAQARILAALAVKVRVIANGHFDSENNRVNFREALAAAASELHDAVGQVPNFGQNKLEALISNMVFSIDDEDKLREFFISTLVHVGEVLICDEKLWFFSGESSGWVRLVISKPDRVGHWFYLAVVQLSNGKHYVVYFRLHRVASALANEQGSLPVAAIVGDWLDILKSSDAEIGEPFLIADSYYMSKSVRDIVKANNLPAIVAVPKERWQNMVSLLENRLSKAGDSASLYNEATDEVHNCVIISCINGLTLHISCSLDISRMTRVLAGSTTGPMAKSSKSCQTGAMDLKAGLKRRPGTSTKRVLLAATCITRP